MALDTEKLINTMDRTLITCLSVSSGLIKRNPFHYTIKGESSALNRKKNSAESVSVAKWFKNFWLFLEIKFDIQQIVVGRKKQPQIGTKISLSVFQGENSDNEKYQLLRAEWDDYNNSEEKHAQPHWHITSSQAIENTIYEYANIFDNQDFLQILESEKEKVIDVKKIHFAMNGNWMNDGSHVHKMNNEQQIAQWLLGLLTHLRTELYDI